MAVESTNKESSSKELFERTEINNTPFELIKINETGKRFVTWGRHRLTDLLNESEAASVHERLERGQVDWDIVGAMMAAIAMDVLNVGNEMVEQIQEEEEA